MYVNKWYFFGLRKFNIIHTKLWHNNSSLIYDLYRFNLQNETDCTCGCECENFITLLWNVLLYDNVRRNLLVILRIYSEIDLNVILYGNTELPMDQNN